MLRTSGASDETRADLRAGISSDGLETPPRVAGADSAFVPSRGTAFGKRANLFAVKKTLDWSRKTRREREDDGDDPVSVARIGSKR